MKQEERGGGVKESEAKDKKRKEKGKREMILAVDRRVKPAIRRTTIGCPGNRLGKSFLNKRPCRRVSTWNRYATR
jgi:hypothetical protein